MSKRLSNSILYERKPFFCSHFCWWLWTISYKDDYEPYQTKHNLDIVKHAPWAEDYQISQLLNRKSFYLRIFLVFYALHFFLPKQGKRLRWDKCSYKFPCFNHWICIHNKHLFIIKHCFIWLYWYNVFMSVQQETWLFIMVKNTV